MECVGWRKENQQYLCFKFKTKCENGSIFKFQAATWGFVINLQFYCDDGVCNFSRQKKNEEKHGQGFDDKMQSVEVHCLPANYQPSDTGKALMSQRSGSDWRAGSARGRELPSVFLLAAVCFS